MMRHPRPLLQASALALALAACAPRPVGPPPPMMPEFTSSPPPVVVVPPAADPQVRTTIVAGTPVYREGEATGALPGRLVRGAKAA